jgi:hypothetical protein
MPFSTVNRRYLCVVSVLMLPKLLILVLSSDRLAADTAGNKRPRAMLSTSIRAFSGVVGGRYRR